MHVPPAVAIATRMYLPKMASELGEVQLPNMAGGAGGCSADAVGLGDGNEAAVRVGVERVAEKGSARDRHLDVPSASVLARPAWRPEGYEYHTVPDFPRG